MGFLKRHGEGKIRKLFLDCITEDSKKYYENNFNKYQTAYDAIADDGWAADTNNILYKKGTKAYLERTENGYVIPNVYQQDIDYLREEKFLKEHSVDIEDYFKSTTELEEFNNGNWDIKYGIDEEKVIKLAEKIGINRTIKGFKGPVFEDKENNKTK